MELTQTEKSTVGRVVVTAEVSYEWQLGSFSKELKVFPDRNRSANGDEF